MNDQKLNFFTKLWYSMTQFSKYPDMIKQGIGKAFLYLVLLTLTLGTVHAVITGYNVSQMIRGFNELVKQELPAFTLQNGELSVEGEMPMVLEETQSSLFMIDVTGEISSDVLDQYEEGALVLKDRVIMKESSYEKREFTFNELEINLTKEDIVTWLPYLEWLGAAAGIFMFFFFFIGKMSSALVISVMSLIFRAIEKASLSFGGLYSMAIYALTLPVILDVLLSIFWYGTPWYLYYGIVFLYMWFGIKQYKNIDDWGKES
ncbi:DUF1189 domain-containing protein [Bacillus taeanensis]|uniref:DUF1189 domain-containing protein n=1 Tax=Bacillus taeanensis TaxID=273032 RepID=A0A366XYQ6_9BACI|nr:DUF1189 domain-containing protein [Bacillus taeanensis]RBW71047.1 hypothetical protein DS031_03380 [Bacillus taeanensis]